MSEIKHTPWIARGTMVFFADNTGGFDLRNCPEPEQKANLCAAAPELLEALNVMVKRIEYYSSLKDDERPNIEQWEYTDGSSDMANARAALAKATGSAS
jgi:hypothetical protein